MEQVTQQRPGIFNNLDDCEEWEVNNTWFKYGIVNIRQECLQKPTFFGPSGKIRVANF